MSETVKAAAGHNAGGPRVKMMRTTLGQVRGLGSAKTGVEHWWTERLTSVAMIPMTLWFIYSALHLAGHSRLEVAHWAANPINAAVMVALLLTVFRHMGLALMVVVDDYIHAPAAHMAMLLLIKGGTTLLALIGVIATLRLAFSG